MHSKKERSELHVGRDGLSYGLEVIAEEEPVRKCSFCGAAYRNIGVQIQTKCGLELCPGCITSGPGAVAKVLKGNEDLKEARALFERLASFAQLPGGILAVKIAEGFRQLGDRAVKEV